MNLMVYYWSVNDVELICWVYFKFFNDFNWYKFVNWIYELVYVYLYVILIFK